MSIVDSNSKRRGFSLHWSFAWFMPFICPVQIEDVMMSLGSKCYRYHAPDFRFYSSFLERQRALEIDSMKH